MKLRIEPPLYMIGMKTSCWRCQARMPVIALLAPRVADTDDEVCILGQIEEMPDDVLAFIQQKVPTFQFRTSKMGGSRYFANTCPKCKAIFGHFFLHAEPGAIFFPTSEVEASSLYMKEIPISRSVIMEASPEFGIGNLIMENAKQI
jgi:hypothetical protein